jgi:hypothetical protein
MRNDKEELERQLAAYETAAKGSVPLERWTGRLGSWPVYAAAAGAALASSTAASASIIYSGIQNVTANITNQHTNTNSTGRRSGHGRATALVDIDGLGNDFKIGVGDSFISPGKTGYFKEFLSGNGSKRLMLQGNSGVARLSSGAKISTAGRFQEFNTLYAVYDLNYGSWFPGRAPAFAGVEFTQGGQEHFGWIQLDLSGNFNTLTAISWAYNSVPGAPITAGDTGQSAVPEPATAALSVLSAGFLGVLAWRRARKDMPGS